MAQNALDRLWNRLVDRYSQDEADGCGCGDIEEAQSDAAETETDGWST